MDYYYVVFEAMLAGQKEQLRVLRRRQFDADPENVTVEGGSVTALRVRDIATGTIERYEAILKTEPRNRSARHPKRGPRRRTKSPVR